MSKNQMNPDGYINREKTANQIVQDQTNDNQQANINQQINENQQQANANNNFLFEVIEKNVQPAEALNLDNNLTHAEKVEKIRDYNLKAIKEREELKHRETMAVDAQVSSMYSVYKKLKTFLYQRGTFGELGDALKAYNNLIQSKIIVSEKEKIKALNSILTVASKYINKHLNDNDSRLDFVQNVYSTISNQVENFGAIKENFEDSYDEKYKGDNRFENLKQTADERVKNEFSNKKTIDEAMKENDKDIERIKSYERDIDQLQEKINGLGTNDANGKLVLRSRDDAKILYECKKKIYMSRYLINRLKDKLINGQCNEVNECIRLKKYNEVMANLINYKYKVEGNNKEVRLMNQCEYLMYSAKAKEAAVDTDWIMAMRTRAFNLYSTYSLRDKKAESDLTKTMLDIGNGKVMIEELDLDVNKMFNNIYIIEKYRQELSKEEQQAADLYIQRAKEYARECGIDLSKPKYSGADQVTKDRTSGYERRIAIQFWEDEKFAGSNEDRMKKLEQMVGISQEDATKLVDEYKTHANAEFEAENGTILRNVPKLDSETYQKNQNKRLKAVTSSLIDKIAQMPEVSEEIVTVIKRSFRNAFLNISDEDIKDRSSFDTLEISEQGYAELLANIERAAYRVSGQDQKLIFKYIAGVEEFSRGTLITEKNAKSFFVMDAYFGECTSKALKAENYDVTFQDVSHMPLFAKTPSVTDIRQGKLGDCFFLAALQSLVSKSPETITEMMRDNGDTVTVRFFYDSKPFYVTVQKTIPMMLTNRSNMSPYAIGPIWVKILEKAATEGLRYYNKCKLDDLMNGKIKSDDIEVQKILYASRVNTSGYEVLDMGGKEEESITFLTGKKAEVVRCFDNKNATLEGRMFPNSNIKEADAAKKISESMGNTEGVVTDKNTSSAVLTSYVAFKSILVNKMTIDKIPLEMADNYTLKRYMIAAIQDIYEAIGKIFTSLDQDETIDENLEAWSNGDKTLSETILAKAMLDFYKNNRKKLKPTKNTRANFDYLRDLIINSVACVNQFTITQMDSQMKAKQGDVNVLVEYSELEISYYNQIKQSLADRKHVLCGTRSLDKIYSDGKQGTVGESGNRGLIQTHSYSIHGCTKQIVGGEEKLFILLKNPHSAKGVNYDYDYQKGSKRTSDYDGEKTINHEYGLFFMELHDFLNAFNTYTVTK